MSLNHFLHVLSASLNLVIISITGTQFRKTLMLMLGIRPTEELIRPTEEFTRSDRISYSFRTEEAFEMRSVKLSRCKTVYVHRTLSVDV